MASRTTLKDYFRAGRMPQEGHFEALIDSMLHKVDDGMDKTPEDGLKLYPVGTSSKLMSFFKNIDEKSAVWSIRVDKDMLNIETREGKSVLALGAGKVGINQPTPRYELHVEGTVGMKGHTGTFAEGKIPADGKWYPLLEQLNGCHAFEIMAGVGKPRGGRYALLKATAISTFGKSNHKIEENQAYYGSRNNQIELRWAGETFNYRLEMRSRSNYGEGLHIKYSVTQLWFDPFMDGTEPDSNSFQQA